MIYSTQLEGDEQPHQKPESTLAESTKLRVSERLSIIYFCDASVVMGALKNDDALIPSAMWPLEARQAARSCKSVCADSVICLLR